jgi:hypothetical protein
MVIEKESGLPHTYKKEGTVEVIFTWEKDV